MGKISRSAVTGRYISRAAAVRHPRKSVQETTGSSGSKGVHHRSAITGRFVTEATARRHPSTTVTERD